MSDELHTPLQVDVDRDKIKRAVKEALDDKAIEDLGKQLTALSNQMTASFARVETRQDTANGKLMKNELGLKEQAKEIDLLKKRDEKLESRQSFWERNQDKIVWGCIGIVLMLFYYLLRNNGFPDFLN
jgi:hypothetical protein